MAFYLHQKESGLQPLGYAVLHIAHKLPFLLLAASAAAQTQQYPIPTPPMQAIIDKDNGRHFGSSPESPGPLAAGLSPALTPQAIDRAVKKVADWQLSTNQPYFDQIWTSSVLYAGFMAASKSTGDPRYRDAMLATAQKYNWTLRNKVANADDEAIGQMYLELYLADPPANRDPQRIASLQPALDMVLPWNTLTLDSDKIPWWWCDALFMAPPVFGRMYAATGDQKYIDYIHTNWHRTYDLLWNPDEHLYARDATYKTRTEPNGKPQFWSRGEGWVMGGIARTIPYLPKNDPDIPFLATQLKEMAARVRDLQGTDGLWHAGLLDPDTYKLPEVSGSSLFTFSIAWGINNGYLDYNTYHPVVAKAWAGILHHVYADGRLGAIQQTGSEPAFYRPSASYDYGVGAFLLAGSELKILASTTHLPTHNVRRPPPRSTH